MRRRVLGSGQDELIVVVLVAVRSAVRWYLRYGLSYRNVEELLG